MKNQAALVKGGGGGGSRDVLRAQPPAPAPSRLLVPEISQLCVSMVLK